MKLLLLVAVWYLVMGLQIAFITGPLHWKFSARSKEYGPITTREKIEIVCLWPWLAYWGYKK